jgi:hypothetical protein
LNLGLYLGIGLGLLLGVGQFTNSGLVTSLDLKDGEANYDKKSFKTYSHILAIVPT